jgi:predicted dithiol-disulfide oxidoreductase (DUF899 family)
MTQIVSLQEWKAARDALAAKRRRMPRTELVKDYAFEGPVA